MSRTPPDSGLRPRVVSWTWPVLLMMATSACITAAARVDLTHRVSRVERIAPSAPVASAMPADHIALVMRDGTRRELEFGTVNMIDDLILVDRGTGTKVHFSVARDAVESVELSQSVLRRDTLGRDTSAAGIERAKQRDAAPQVLRAERVNHTGAVVLGVVGGVAVLGALLIAIACSDGCFGG